MRKTEIKRIRRLWRIKTMFALALIALLGVATVAVAQNVVSRGFSLNSPATFPVDI